MAMHKNSQAPNDSRNDSVLPLGPLHKHICSYESDMWD